MIDGFLLGWTHALFAAAYLAGAALPAVVALTPVAAALALRPWWQHRRAVAYVRRQTRRSGRTS